jgi:hypothetical protein
MNAMENGTSPEAVDNLRTARKAQAAMRKAAAPAPAKKAPAKKAPAKPAAKKPAASGATKLRWTFPSGYDERAQTGQTAAFGGGELAMVPVDGKWRATFTKGGQVTVLAEGVGAAKAYAACVGYTKSNGAAA